jgi:hypothetical protein
MTTVATTAATRKQATKTKVVKKRAASKKKVVKKAKPSTKKTTTKRPSTKKPSTKKVATKTKPQAKITPQQKVTKHVDGNPYRVPYPLIGAGWESRTISRRSVSFAG